MRCAFAFFCRKKAGGPGLSLSQGGLPLRSAFGNPRALAPLQHLTAVLSWPFAELFLLCLLCPSVKTSPVMKSLPPVLRSPKRPFAQHLTASHRGGALRCKAMCRFFRGRVLHLSDPRRSSPNRACKAGQNMQGCRDVAYAPGVVGLSEVKLQDDAGPEHRGRLRRASERERGRERERERSTQNTRNSSPLGAPMQSHQVEGAAHGVVQELRYSVSNTSLPEHSRAVLFDAVASRFSVPCHFSLGSPGRVTGGSWQFMWKVCTRAFTPSSISFLLDFRALSQPSQRIRLPSFPVRRQQTRLNLLAVSVAISALWLSPDGPPSQTEHRQPPVLRGRRSG